jgi:hypothetical protein
MPAVDSNDVFDDTHISLSIEDKEQPDDNGSIHPSAMPTPLYANRQQMESTFLAPPEDLLTHFDITNAHVMRATEGLHEKIQAYGIEVTRELRRKHSESVTTLNKQFGEVYDRIRAVEHDVGRVIGSVTDTQETLTTKLEALAATIQQDFVRRLDEVLFMQSEMARKVDSIAAQLQDVQVKQQYMMDSFKASTRASFWQNPSPTAFEQQHMYSHARSPLIQSPMNMGIPINTPQAAYNGQNMGIESFNGQPQVTTLGSRAYTHPHGMQSMSQPPPGAFAGNVYASQRPNGNGQVHDIATMNQNNSMAYTDHYVAQMNGNTEVARANGQVKKGVNGED